MILGLAIGLVVGVIAGATLFYLFLRQNKDKAARIAGTLDAWDAGKKKE